MFGTNGAPRKVHHEAKFVDSDASTGAKSSKLRLRKFGAAAALSLAGFGISSLVVPVAAHADGNGQYQHTLASPSLNERSAPSTGASIVGSLPYYSSIFINCQTTGSVVNGSNIWDRLSNGSYISDYWTTTTVFNGYTQGIPQCSTTTTQTANVGKTVTYPEGILGQCTRYAIDEFHAFDGRYPDFVANGNNGNAMYWAGNAATNGWTVTATPRVHSIAVFQPYVNGAGSVGHVAWVTAVRGAQITVTEMDFPYAYTVDTRTLTPASTVRYILAP